MTKDYKTWIVLVDSITEVPRIMLSVFFVMHRNKHHKLYACLFTRQKEKSSLTKLAAVCFKKKLSECTMKKNHCTFIRWTSIVCSIVQVRLSQSSSANNVARKFSRHWNCIDYKKTLQKIPLYREKPPLHDMTKVELCQVFSCSDVSLLHHRGRAIHGR